MSKIKIDEITQMMNKNSYMSIITSMLSNLITVENLPDDLKSNFDLFVIETLLTGSGFIVKGDDGTPHYTHGELVAPYDDFYYGKNYITFTHTGTEYKGELNKTGCVIFPYSSRHSINIIKKTCIELNDIDVSTEFLIKWARVAPFLIGKDGKTLEALKDVVKSVMSGNLQPMLSANVLNNLDGENPVLTVDVMQPDRIKDLQYLNEHRENVIKHIFNLFGMPVQCGTKRAQQSVDEINGFNGECFIIPMDILKNFNIFAENLNNTFGWDVKFNLNTLVLAELEKYYNQSETDSNTGENIQDELNNDTNLEPEPEQERDGDTIDE